MLLLIDMIFEEIQQLARMIGVETLDNPSTLAVFLADFAS